MKHKYRVIKGKDVDHKRWDEIIANSSNEHLYAYSWFLDLVCPEWYAIVSKEYTTGSVIPTKRKMGISYVHQPHLLQRIGFYGDANEEIKSIYQQEVQRYKWVDLTLENDLFEGSKKLTNLILKPEDVGIEALSTNTKRNIKKFVGSKGRIDHHREPDLIPELIQLFKSNKATQLGRIEESFYEMLEKVGIEASKRNQLHLFTTEKNGIIEGGIMAIHTLKRSVLLFSAAGKDTRSSGAMHALVWEAIQQSVKQKLLFDFEGSSNPGTARFYGGFGAEKETYYYFRKRLI